MSPATIYNNCRKLFFALAVTLPAMSRTLANETDWLYFPMYPNDTAHAVHLAALQFRPDGLLTSATRYPRFPDEPWTAKESKLGWYNYHPRLIDCETGLDVIKGISLLDRSGRVIAEKSYSQAKMVEHLIDKLRTNQEYHWPSNSEIFMACAAASNPTLLKQHATAAQKQQPVISNKPITADLKEDSSAILKLQQLCFDFDAIIKKRPPSATVLFDQLRLQYGAWRKSIDKQYEPDATDPVRDAETLRKANAELKEKGLQPNTLRKLNGSVIEFEQEWSPPYGYIVPKAAVKAETAAMVVRADCLSGIELHIATNWLAADRKVLLNTPVTTKEAISDLKQRYGEERQIVPDLWNRNWGIGSMLNSAPYCQLVNRIAHPRHESENDAPLPFGLTKESIEQEKTPEAMLLKIRAAWRAQRP